MQYKQSSCKPTRMALNARSPCAHSHRVRRTMHSWIRKHWHWCSESNASTSSSMSGSSPCSRTISHSPPSWVRTPASPPSQPHTCKGGLSSCLHTLMRSVSDAQKSMPMQTVCHACHSTSPLGLNDLLKQPPSIWAKFMPFLLQQPS